MLKDTSLNVQSMRLFISKNIQDHLEEENNFHVFFFIKYTVCHITLQFQSK